MNTIQRLVLLPVWLTLTCPPAFGQGESAVPFLLITPNPEANGWGGVTTSVTSDNPMASIFNPAQLGLSSLSNFFSASTYSPKSKWLPVYNNNDLTYNVTAVNAGANIASLLDLDVPVGLGIGYSRVFLNLGTFVRTSSNGLEPVGTFQAEEKSESFSIAIGFDYILRAGIGMNFKRIVSTLGPGIEIDSESGETRASARDFGVLVQAPVIGIIERFTPERIQFGSQVNPLFDITFGYNRNNIGREVHYSDASQSDPLPRNATIGLSAEIGVTIDIKDRPWKFLTFTLAREAEDLLVRPTGSTILPDSSGYAPSRIEYQSGLGDISFFKHVITGRLDNSDRAKLHKGWQINFGEFLYIRQGSFSESPQYGNRNYTTTGFGVRLGGLFKFLEAFAENDFDDGALSFVARHIDLMYDHAEYGTTGPLGGTTFNALTLVVR